METTRKKKYVMYTQFGLSLWIPAIKAILEDNSLSPRKRSDTDKLSRRCLYRHFLFPLCRRHISQRLTMIMESANTSPTIFTVFIILPCLNFTEAPRERFLSWMKCFINQLLILVCFDFQLLFLLLEKYTDYYIGKQSWDLLFQIGFICNLKTAPLQSLTLLTFELRIDKSF